MPCFSHHLLSLVLAHVLAGLPWWGVIARFAGGLGVVTRSVSDCDAHHLLSYNSGLRPLDQI